MKLKDRIDAAEQTLRSAMRTYRSVAFATSFGAEDMVLLDLIERLGLEVDAFTLDTGRLHEETYALIAQVRQRYRTPVRVVFPDATRLEALVATQGVNGFRDGITQRKACCAVRKLEPLARALQGHDLWITGLRREQSPTRSDVAVLEHDTTNGVAKLNPLADWSSDEVLGYVEEFAVPINALHARGFPSIGCAPCTRAVLPGEDERAGRWWWEQPLQRECGLHIAPDGRLVRGHAD